MSTKYNNGREAQPGDEVVGTCWPLGKVTQVDRAHGRVYVSGFGWVPAKVLLVCGDS